MVFEAGFPDENPDDHKSFNELHVDFMVISLEHDWIHIAGDS